ncbi:MULTISPECIES: RNA polymerase factor sigma-70 [Acinetobacter]|jgi:RNA polymerase sigma-70 factor (ECF subfamily)|uniref:RNA polymerase factor sigma-70 n=1 Tax=Acinetobacter pittii TaxID=48296 RepID=A0AAE9M6E1_ACIPI|nr:MULTISPECIES: RNA polymerase factor sigma-70 [Acinetobacter calcoaceticus/baumannii complex]AZP29864.1 RNA polymerase subunit sigma [Acinetobacter pittii]EXC26669.1 RNA polymerase sigma factor, sigma-70 family protein [Acinetobacter sp. 809848]EXE27390.1 RNA polymerase sigma factor, sigma-70 family protein [Acinetobacter sp. 907131]EXS16667.1 RNA polymerase sigma factor, sigma-70 family protein [Acinetobacter sp. 883425]MBJ8478484.1 RNA polymerase factor sigma-70 [Acinetobacter pittii]
MTSAVASDHEEIGDQLHNPAFLQDLRQQMIKFAFLQLSSLPQAEDVVQEALTSAFQHLDSFKGRAAFKTWVFAILKNKIIDVIRQKSRLVAMTELFKDEESELSIDALFDASGHWHKYEAPQAWQSPEEMMEQADFWIIFEACLNHLPAKYAQVFMMREVIELSSNEICSKLELSISNFNVLMYRSRTRLRECLENKWLLKEDCSC